MTLSRPVKLVVGALSTWPFVYMFLFFGYMATSFFSITRTGGQTGEHSSGMPDMFVLIFAAHFGTILMMFGLLTFYIVYLFKTDRVSQDKKALWAAVLFLGNMIAMPVFFCIYIWPDKWPRKVKGESTKVTGGSGGA